MSELKRARIKSTGKEIEVYMTIRSTYCDIANCKTEYKKEELIFLN